MDPTGIPTDLDDRYPLTLDEFCKLTKVPRPVLLDWYRRGLGPRWTPFNGRGRLHITVAEARQFVRSEPFASGWRSGRE